MRPMLFLPVGLIVALASTALEAAQPKPIATDQFASLHKMIKAQAGESLFWNVPWLTSMREARRKAAAEGKPIIVWSGSGGAPVGVC